MIKHTQYERMMKYRFVPMTAQFANEMITGWKYDGDYAVYDYVNEAECLLAEEKWGIERFAALDESGALMGELTAEFFLKGADDDGYVEAARVKNYPKSQLELWVGFGLRPNLVGQGHGADFVKACVAFAKNFHDFGEGCIRLAVAAFNVRAVKTYQKAGFKPFERIEAEIGGEMQEIIWMQLEE